MYRTAARRLFRLEVYQGFHTWRERCEERSRRVRLLGRAMSALRKPCLRRSFSAWRRDLESARFKAERLELRQSLEAETSERRAAAAQLKALQSRLDQLEQERRIRKWYDRWIVMKIPKKMTQKRMKILPKMMERLTTVSLGRIVRVKGLGGIWN